MTDDAPESSMATPDRAAVWEDFIDIFFAPSRVFARRAMSSPWVPLIVVTLGMAVLVYLNAGLLEPIMSAEFNRGMAAAMRSNPKITPEMVSSMRGTALRIGQFAGILTPIGIVITGTVVWLLGKLFDATQPYRAAIMVAAFAYMPRLLEAEVSQLQALLLDPEQLDGRFRLSLGIGRFFDPNVVSPILLGLVGRIDVFTIWVTVLLALGLSVTGGITRRRALLAAPLIWLLGAIPLVLQALRG